MWAGGPERRLIVRPGRGRGGRTARRRRGRRAPWRCRGRGRRRGAAIRRGRPRRRRCRRRRGRLSFWTGGRGRRRGRPRRRGAAGGRRARGRGRGTGRAGPRLEVGVDDDAVAGEQGGAGVLQAGRVGAVGPRGGVDIRIGASEAGELLADGVGADPREAVGGEPAGEGRLAGAGQAGDEDEARAEGGGWSSRRARRRRRWAARRARRRRRRDLGFGGLHRLDLGADGRAVGGVEGEEGAGAREEGAGRELDGRGVGGEVAGEQGVGEVVAGDAVEVHDEEGEVGRSGRRSGTDH
jgi:hypothetical protein